MRDQITSDHRSHVGTACVEELRHWARARRYRDRAAEALELARNTPDPDIQNRYLTIAQHYRMLAAVEERTAEQRGAERRSRAALNDARGIEQG